MNMKYAIDSIVPGGAQDAAKDTSWGAYVHKTTSGLSTADVEAGKFKLIFVQRDGDQYVFTYNGTSSYAYTGYIAKGSGGAKGTGSPVAGTSLTLDALLLDGMLSENWITGTLADFESARSGSGEW